MLAAFLIERQRDMSDDRFCMVDAHEEKLTEKLFFVTARGEEELLKELLGRFCDRPVSAHLYDAVRLKGVRTLEIYPVSKRVGAEELKGLTGAKRIVAFGDNGNDEGLFEAADVRVAVGNATPALKSLADRIIGPNDEDTVVRTIMEMGRDAMALLTAMGLDGNTLEGLVKIVSALIVGALVGWERERGNQPAGLRTHMLVCMGACLVMWVSIWYADGSKMGDPMRMGAQVISGIGFLGAGTIIKGDYGVRGLTTAASLWVVACIGLALGAGFYWGAIVGAVLTYAALVFFKSVEERAVHGVVRLHLCAQDNGSVAGEIVQTLLHLEINITQFHTQRADGHLLMTVCINLPKGGMRTPQIVERLMAIDGMESVRDR